MVYKGYKYAYQLSLPDPPSITRSQETTVVYRVILGIMEKKMETTIMENQMEKKMENEMDTGTIHNAGSPARALMHRRQKLTRRADRAFTVTNYNQDARNLQPKWSVEES